MVMCLMEWGIDAFYVKVAEAEGCVIRPCLLEVECFYCEWYCYLLLLHAAGEEIGLLPSVHDIHMIEKW